MNVVDLERDEKFWYLATPYSKWRGGLEDAFRQACLLTGKLIRLGVPVYSPIAHTHPVAIACDIDPLDHGIWIPADRSLMVSAQGLVVAAMEGWDRSFGIRQEIIIFRDRKRPIYLMDVETLNLEVIS